MSPNLDQSPRYRTKSGQTFFQRPDGWRATKADGSWNEVVVVDHLGPDPPVPEVSKRSPAMTP